jgi:hypothetical protein
MKARRRSFECEHRGYQISSTVGTPFEKTRTSLRYWFYVMLLFCSTRNGAAAKELERQLGVTLQKWHGVPPDPPLHELCGGDYPDGWPRKIVEVHETLSAMPSPSVEANCNFSC